MACSVKRGAIIFIIAMTVGAGFGLLARSNGRAGKSAIAEKSQATRPHERDQQRADHPKWSTEDLIKRAKETAEARKHPLAANLESWTDAEIEAALNETLSKPEWLLSSLTEPNATSEAAFELLRVWMRRDFDAAFAWFSGVQDGIAKEQLAVCLGENWPDDRASEGFALLRIYPEIFPVGNPARGKFNIQGLQDEAAKGGAVGLGALLAEMHAEQLLYNRGFTPGPELPDDFDFDALAATDALKDGWGTTEVRGLVSQWMANDAESAVAWVLKTEGPSGVYNVIEYGCYTNTLNAIGEQIENWSEEDRSEFLDTIEKQVAGQLYTPSSVISGLAKGMSDPAVADEIREVGIQGMFAGKTSAVLPVLDEMDPARRVDALLTATLDVPNGRRNFGQSDEELLRKKLNEWQVSAEQTEEIVQRFKP
ncbi:hypothetical protein JIN85_11770 [Luteolibacter pohnpeiensis]|uniref:Uncharacterized protein n=1 Tax=Luteolibacter pohnpeiensis TaxID=454153 RepID=A0A934SD78_9BACT|nr:hypothetical protein [Luteolibacter pohnpeiensis]MBK1883098.1 hypothetical protein [Luteolibacter pohnpeiensis]